MYNYYTPYFLFQIEAHAVRHNKTPDISSDINTQAKEVGTNIPTSFACVLIPEEISEVLLCFTA